MSGASSDLLLRSIQDGLRDFDGDPIGWLETFLVHLKAKPATGILASQEEAGPIALGAEAPTALVIDCGTSETKVLEFSVVQNRVSVKELAKMRAASTYAARPQDFIGPLRLQLSASNARMVLISASSWMRNADEASLNTGNALLQPLLEAGVTCKILEPKEEAWFELAAAEYADETQNWRITATWAAGGGSTQMTQDFERVHTLNIGNERGQTLLRGDRDNGVHEWREGVRRFYRSAQARLSGRILCISAVYHAAIESGLQANILLDRATVCAHMEAFVQAKLGLPQWSSDDIRNLANVLQQLETVKAVVAEDAHLCFARDLAFEGRPYRISWSTGWYLHLLQELGLLKFQSHALRSFRVELAALRKLGSHFAQDGSNASVPPSAVGQVLLDVDNVADLLSKAAHELEPTVTDTLERAARQYGCVLGGLDWRIKARDSLLRKLRYRLARLIERHSDHPLYMPRVSDVVHEVDDVLRYTIISDTGGYVGAVKGVIETLEQALTCTVKCFSFWQAGSTYAGINAYVTTPQLTFEVQFHTEESWRVKQNESHDIYKGYRALPPGRARFILYETMKTIWSSVPTPPSIALLGPAHAMNDKLMEQIGAVEDAVRYFASGCPPQQSLRSADLCYRLVRGRSAEEFSHLAYPPAEKRLAWVSQSADGLQRLLFNAHHHRSELPRLIAEFMGKPLSWVQEKRTAGFNWRLVIMPRGQAVSGDWTGALQLIQQAYPEISGHIALHHEALENMSLTEIEGQLDPPATFRAIKDAGRTHPQYVDLERLMRSKRASLWQVRAFLFNVAGLNELYNGTGRLQSSQGTLNEFLVRNAKLEDIPGCRIIDLH